MVEGPSFVNEEGEQFSNWTQGGRSTTRRIPQHFTFVQLHPAVSSQPSTSSRTSTTETSMPPPSRRPPAVNPIADLFRNAGALSKEMIETDEAVEEVRAFEQHGSQLSSTGGASAYLPYTAGMVSSHPQSVTQCDDVRAEDPRMQQAIGESLQSPPPSPRTSATFTQPTIFGAKPPPPLPPKARSTKSKSSPAAQPPPSNLQASFFVPRG
jgi:hypothetical protein